MSEKIIAASPIPPSAGEERDSDKRTMGVGSPVPIRKLKNIAAGSIPPRLLQGHLRRGNDAVR
jgi:hypothetical protein